MEDFELTNDALINIAEYMNGRGLSYRTKVEYINALKLIKKTYKVINQKVVNKVISKNGSNRNKAVFSLVNDYCIINEIPFMIRLPRSKTKIRKLPEILSKEEVKIIIDSVPKPYDLMLRIMYSSGAGLRVSEIITMTFERFNWSVWVSKLIEEPEIQRDGILRIKEGKGGKDRVVNVPYSLMNDIYNYAKELDILDERRCPNPNVRVFKFGYEDYGKFTKKYDLLNRDKKRAKYIGSCYDWIKYHIFKKHCSVALGRAIRIHSLRHSRATHLYEEGITIEKIQKLLGHASIENTMIYARVSERETLKSMKGVKEI